MSLLTLDGELWNCSYVLKIHLHLHIQLILIPMYRTYPYLSSSVPLHFHITLHLSSTSLSAWNVHLVHLYIKSTPRRLSQLHLSTLHFHIKIHLNSTFFSVLNVHFSNHFYLISTPSSVSHLHLSTLHFHIIYHLNSTSFSALIKRSSHPPLPHIYPKPSVSTTPIYTSFPDRIPLLLIPLSFRS